MGIKMKLVLLLVFISIFSSCKEEKPIMDVIDKALSSAVQQSLLMAKEYENDSLLLPRSFENGKMTSSGAEWWTSGFFPGTLWYLYENTGDSLLLHYAMEYTHRIEKEKYATNNHDIGFMIFSSFGNGYRLTNDSCYKNVLLLASNSLSKRYNPNIGLIRSWDFNKEQWQYPVIIDNMMNLEILLWASKNGGKTLFKEIAISHADKTWENHYRDDFSCYHVVSYDTITGFPHVKQTHQGFSDESVWSRGQTWGLYGYTMMYRETHDIKYLEYAEKIADYLINHPNMPEDFIPFWDLKAPGIPNELRDASSAAIMASALIELSDYVDKSKSEIYMEVARKQIRELASPKYTAGIGENGFFILKHSVGNYPINSEIDAPLTFADYYYVEALTRLKKRLGN